MQKEPLKKLFDKIKDSHERYILQEKELQCTSYLYKFFENQTAENYYVFKRLYNTLPFKSKRKVLNYYVVYMKNKGHKKETINKKTKIKKGK